MVRENQKTDIKGKRFFVVDANSAAPPLPGVTYYGIEANHADMCKYDSMQSPGFRNIAITLREWVEKAPFLIQQRWLVEEDEGRHRALARVNEIMRRPSQRSLRVSHEENEKQLAGRTSRFIEDMQMQEYRDSSLSDMTQHIRNMSEGCIKETLSPGASSVPSMDITNENWHGQHRGLISQRSRHSEASLNTGFGYWAQDMPINTNSAKDFCHLPGHPQDPSSHRRALNSDGFLSSSLPTSLGNSTLKPPSAAVRGYTSQPASRQSSPRSDISVPYTPACPWPGHAPSTVATGLWPWHEGISANNVPFGHQAWHSRQTGPWDYCDASYGDTAYSPKQDMPSESKEMMRSGSEEIQFNEDPVVCGQLEHRKPQTVRPSECESPPPENQGTKQGEMESQHPDYSQS
ncbi:hypothetical protein FPOAC1_010744 [Fusarium poae]|nr:hypothetical protein FPOAC1_010744 [Fusarium poae]KAG8665943.1 hypothetical protein FPOAC1_010744 [Fusarium poae]